MLRVDADFLETLANAAFIRIVSASARELSGELRRDRAAEPDGAAGQEAVTVDAAELTKLPAALATRVARYALETANPSRSSMA